MSAGTDRIDAEIQKVLRDRLKLAAAIDVKLAETDRLRRSYAGTQARIDALLSDRTDVAHAEAVAAMTADAEALATVSATPPPPPTPATHEDGTPLPAACTCGRILRAAPCPVHGHRPSHL